MMDDSTYYVHSPNWVLRILIWMFGEYTSEVGYNDGEDAEIFHYYMLFKNKVYLGVEFRKNYPFEITHSRN